MNLRLITPPAAEPVEVAAAKTFLRVDVATDDALITSLLKSARQKVEELSRRALITQTWEQVENRWPANMILKIYRPPLQSVTSVTLYDYYNAASAWTDYQVDANSEPGHVIFRSVPGISLLDTGGIVVQFKAGYGDTAADVPERFKELILALTGYWYENRQVADVPQDLARAIVGERAVWF
jgi:uncharacterized phiE125 gp8 family phage protein